MVSCDYTSSSRGDRAGKFGLSSSELASEVETGLIEGQHPSASYHGAAADAVRSAFSSLSHYNVMLR